MRRCESGNQWQSIAQSASNQTGTDCLAKSSQQCDYLFFRVFNSLHKFVWFAQEIVCQWEGVMYACLAEDAIYFFHRRYAITALVRCFRIFTKVFHWGKTFLLKKVSKHLTG